MVRSFVEPEEEFSADPESRLLAFCGHSLAVSADPSGTRFAADRQELNRFPQENIEAYLPIKISGLSILEPAGILELS